MGIGIKGRAAVVALLGGVSAASAQPFTYQGSLSDGGQPADGVYDLRVTLLNNGGGTVAGPLTFDDIAVSDGVFSVELDFGAGSFDGNARLLGLEFRDGGSAGGFTELLPNTPISPTPYALYALDAFSEITRDGDVLRVGAGTGSEAVIINPDMPNGERVNQFTEFQVNFAEGNSGGIYVNGGGANDLPFYGFSIQRTVEAFIDYNRADDQIRFWDGGAYFPTMTVNPSEVFVSPDLTVGGTVSASQELRSEFDTVVGDDLEVGDDIVKDYGTNEFFRAVPSAYGAVGSSGSLVSGTPNVSVVWNSALGRYEIDFSDLSFSINSKTAVVSPVSGTTPRIATVTSVGGMMIVYIYDLNGNQFQSRFNFIVFDNASPSTLLDTE